jgi:hypothetical protein
MWTRKIVFFYKHTQLWLSSYMTMGFICKPPMLPKSDESHIACLVACEATIYSTFVKHNNRGLFLVIPIDCTIFVVTPPWSKCEEETHTPKSGNLESSGTPAISELDSKGQNTLPWGGLYTIGKVLKCRYPKWPRMSHLDICSPSYVQKKG